jgi:hypothetical protein
LASSRIGNKMVEESIIVRAVENFEKNPENFVDKLRDHGKGKMKSSPEVIGACALVGGEKGFFRILTCLNLVARNLPLIKDNQAILKAFKRVHDKPMYREAVEVADIAKRLRGQSRRKLLWGGQEMDERVAATKPMFGERGWQGEGKAQTLVDRSRGKMKTKTDPPHTR